MPELSIIIPTLIENKEDIPAVRSLQKQDFGDYEVLVERGNSASSSRNKGIDDAKSDKIVFLDDDSIVREEYLQKVSKILEDHDVVRGKIIHPSDGVFYEISKKSYDLGDNKINVNSLIGCNMAIRRKVLEDVGGFDEDLPYGHEESELAYRINKDYTITYSPSIKVEHYYAESFIGFLKKSFRHGYYRPIYWDKTKPSSYEKIEALIPYASAESLQGTVVYTAGSAAGTLGLLKFYISKLIGRD